MGFLIIINFILVLFAIFATIILYIRQNQLLELEKKYKQLNEQLEDSMSSFFMQMQEENETFIKKLKELQSNRDSLMQAQDSPFHIENRETRLSPEHQLNNDVISIKKPPLYSGIKSYQKMQEISKLTESEKASDKQVDKEVAVQDIEQKADINNGVMEENEVLTEHEMAIKQIKEPLKAGKTVEEIAKQLNRGKTEVELLIKFSPELQELQK